MNIMHNKASKLLVAMVASITLLLCLPLTAAAQGPEYQVLFDPTPVEVGSGNPFTVTLRMIDINSPGPNVSAYDIDILYNRAIINFDVNEGDHDWSASPFGTPFVFNVDNTAGIISFAAFLAQTPLPQGDMTIGELSGTALSPGTSPLQFNKFEIVDFDGSLIGNTTTDGEVIVTSSAPPAIPTMSQWGAIGMAILFGALLIWFVRRRWVANASES